MWKKRKPYFKTKFKTNKVGIFKKSMELIILELVCKLKVLSAGNNTKCRKETDKLVPYILQSI